jgi:cytochrome c553
MRTSAKTLLDEARSALSACANCPDQATCAFTSTRYQPGYCLHEYKLLHQALMARLTAHPTLGAAQMARLSDELAQYAEFLRRQRPFDVRRTSNVGPRGPDVPFLEPTPQTNLMAFG